MLFRSHCRPTSLFSLFSPSSHLTHYPSVPVPAPSPLRRTLLHCRRASSSPGNPAHSIFLYFPIFHFFISFPLFPYFFLCFLFPSLISLPTKNTPQSRRHHRCYSTHLCCRRASSSPANPAHSISLYFPIFPFFLSFPVSLFLSLFSLFLTHLPANENHPHPFLHLSSHFSSSHLTHFTRFLFLYFSLPLPSKEKKNLLISSPSPLVSSCYSLSLLVFDAKSSSFHLPVSHLCC